MQDDLLLLKFPDQIKRYPSSKLQEEEKERKIK
jgi:hypothetical protein